MCKKIKSVIVHINPSIKAIVIFLAFIIISFLVPNRKINIYANGILAASSIFYSILLGFYVSAAMTNLSRLKTLVSTETGALIAIFHIVKLSLPEKIDDARENIDQYLIKRFEYEVDSYTEPTTIEFFRIFDVLIGAEGKSG